MDNENNSVRLFNSQRAFPVHREILILMQKIFQIKKNLERLQIKNTEQWDLIKIDFMSRIANANTDNEE